MRSPFRFGQMKRGCTYEFLSYVSFSNYLMLLIVHNTAFAFHDENEVIIDLLVELFIYNALYLRWLQLHPCLAHCHFQFIDVIILPSTTLYRSHYLSS